MHDGEESKHELLDLFLFDFAAGEDEAEAEVDQPDCLVVADGFFISGVSLLLGEQEILEDRMDVDVASDCLGDEKIDARLGNVLAVRHCKLGEDDVSSLGEEAAQKAGEVFDCFHHVVSDVWIFQNPTLQQTLNNPSNTTAATA